MASCALPRQCLERVDTASQSTSSYHQMKNQTESLQAHSPDNITRDELAAAVKQGVLSAGQLEQLQGFVISRRTKSATADEEGFRFIRSFNDIFVTIAIALVLFAVGSLGWTISDGVGMALVAATSWGLAEYFTRKRRMAFPSIVLLVTFVTGLFWSVSQFAGGASFESSEGALPVLAAGIVSGLGALAHWFRFHVPITVAAGIASLIAIAFSLLLALNINSDTLFALFALACGLATLALAIATDMRDRLRLTLKTDIAFWLHLLAAPLIVHGLFELIGLFDGEATTAESAIVLAIYAVFALVALVIDRRALLVSSLAYVLYAVFELVVNTGLQDYSAGITALIIGGLLLLLSAAWTGLRNATVSKLPESITSRVCPAG